MFCKFTQHLGCGQVDLKLKIKAIRKKLKFTQASFAKSLGMSASSYQGYELGVSAVPSNLLLKITEEFPEYTLWLMTGETNIPAGQISPDDEKPKMEGAAVPAELLDAAFERMLTASIALGWLTPKPEIQFSMLADLLRHDFVAEGGKLIEQSEDERDVV